MKPIFFSSYFKKILCLDLIVFMVLFCEGYSMTVIVNGEDYEIGAGEYDFYDRFVNGGVNYGDQGKTGIIQDGATITANPNATGAPFLHAIYLDRNANLLGGSDITLIGSSKSDSDGLRPNPGGGSGWENARAQIVIGDRLTIMTYGASGDAVNMNGRSQLTVGNDAKFIAYGGNKLFGEGSHALRANHEAIINVGGNAYMETNGARSYGVYVAVGTEPEGTACNYNSSITLGDGAHIVTKGAGAHGVVVDTANGFAEFLGSVVIDIQSSEYDLLSGYARGVSVSGENGQVKFGGSTTISTKGASAHAIYTGGANSKVTLGTSTTISNAGATSHSFYAQSGRIEGTSKVTVSSNGSVRAGSGVVDIVMVNGSYFNGKSGFDSALSTGEIHIDMQQSSKWQISEWSYLTSLEVDDSSMLVFTITEQFKNTGITANSEILFQNSLMQVILDGYDAQLGDEFSLVKVEDGGTYTASGVRFDFSQAVLSAGLSWDTSTFMTDGKIRVTDLIIPESATVSFALTGLLAATMRRRRQRV